MSAIFHFIDLLGPKDETITDCKTQVADKMKCTEQLSEDPC